jgi:hypothetical protein
MGFLILIGGFARADESLPAGLRLISGAVNGVIIECDGKSLHL